MHYKMDNVYGKDSFYPPPPLFFYREYVFLMYFYVL